MIQYKTNTETHSGGVSKARLNALNESYILKESSENFHPLTPFTECLCRDKRGLTASQFIVTVCWQTLKKVHTTTEMKETHSVLSTYYL